jgi:ribosomal protein S1
LRDWAGAGYSRPRQAGGQRRGSSRAGTSGPDERVEGAIFNRVKGGFTVDLDGAVAFLPRSQVDIRPVRDVSR